MKNILCMQILMYFLLVFCKNTTAQGCLDCNLIPAFCISDLLPNECTYYYDIDPADNQPKWFNSDGSIIGNNPPNNINSGQTACVLTDYSGNFGNNIGGNIFLASNTTFTGAVGSLQSTASLQIAGTFDISNTIDLNNVEIQICETGVFNWPGAIQSTINMFNYGSFTTVSNLNFNGGTSVTNCENATIEALNGNITLDGTINNCGVMIAAGNMSLNANATIYNECTFYAHNDMHVDPDDVVNDGIFIVEGTLTLNTGKIENNGSLKVGDIYSSSGSADAITSTSTGQVVVEGTTIAQNIGLLLENQLWCEQNNAATCSFPAVCSGNANCVNVQFADVYSDDNNDSLAVYCGSSLLLPLELVSFEGTTTACINTLNWETSLEINTDLFELQSSIEGRHYTVIAEIKAAGNSNSSKFYRFVDRSPSNKTMYYRLKQVDLDGVFSYSPTIVLRSDCRSLSSSFPTNQIFPNPIVNNLNMHFTFEKEQQVETTILDISGKVVYSESHQIGVGLTVHTVNLDFLPSGTYLVKTQGDQWFSKSKKIVKLK